MTTSSDGYSRLIAPRRVLVDDVYDAVTALLIDGVIQPGERANIESIARELGVSATPVREALARLESEGLVVKQALKGYTAAAPLDAKGLDDLFAVRLLLEPHAARLAASRIAASTLADLRAWVDDTNATVHDDAILHRSIAESTGNPILAESIARLRPHRHPLDFGPEDTARADGEHEAIVRALEARDEAAAELAMRTHLANSRERAASWFVADAETRVAGS